MLCLIQISKKLDHFDQKIPILNAKGPHFDQFFGKMGDFLFAFYRGARSFARGGVGNPLAAQRRPIPLLVLKESCNLICGHSLEKLG